MADNSRVIGWLAGRHASAQVMAFPSSICPESGSFLRAKGTAVVTWWRCLLWSTLILALPTAMSAQSSVAVPAIQRGHGLLTLTGHAAKPFADTKAKLLVFIFLRTDCPIANTYAPEILKLSKRFESAGVTLSLVYPDATETPEAIRQHMRAYGYTCAALRDPNHEFVRESKVHVTPEAAMYRRDGGLLYHGRIDDRFVELGKMRPTATRHDLADAIQQAIDGKPISPPGGEAVGCFIESDE